MRILVVASGGVGTAAAPIAARRGFFEHMVVADYDIDGARLNALKRYGRDPLDHECPCLAAKD